MMLTIMKLFGRSPFAPLENHMKQVSECVHMIPELFDAIDKKNYMLANELAEKISDHEHKADLIKNDIRNHLPKSLFLPIGHAQLLEILTLQDSLADRAEDIAVLATLKEIEIFEPIREPFLEFINQNLITFNGAQAIIHELHELIETTFGGMEAKKVRAMVDEVAFQEHQADLLQRNLLKKIFESENLFTLSSFHIWQKILEQLSDISNLSETLAYRMRMNLELKG